MQALELVVDDLRALAVELVDDAGDRLLIAGDGGGRDDDPVAVLDVDLLVAGEGHAVQGGHVLALGAGGDHHHLVLRQGFDLGQVHQGVLRRLDVVQIHGDLDHVLHAAAGDGHLAAVAVGGLEHRLEPVQVGGKGGEDDPLVAILELPVEVVRHAHFRGGVALPLHVGGVAQQRQHAPIAQLAEAGQIHHALAGGGVDLEIAGKHHRTHRRGDGKRHGVGNGMVDVDELHLEAAGLDHLAGGVGHELDLVAHAVLLELQLDEAGGEPGGVHRGVDRLQNIGQRTDVVLMAVGDEKAAQLFRVLDKIGHVGDDKVYAVHVFFREGNAAVDHNHVLAVFQHRHVLADLVQTAKGDNFQFFSQSITTPF